MAIAHLSACVECRHELAETQRALEAVGVGRRATRRWTIVVAGVAAALVIAVLPVTLRYDPRKPPRFAGRHASRRHIAGGRGHSDHRDRPD